MRSSLQLQFLLRCLCLLFGVSHAGADVLEERLSFGQLQGRISPNNRAIPGWSLRGDPTPPQLVRCPLHSWYAMLVQVLTNPSYLIGWYLLPHIQAIEGPPFGMKIDWRVNFEFRATGPDRGGGNLQIWYARDGQSMLGKSSIYTAGRFDGLGIVIDTYGGRGGSVRAFLDDGTTDFSKHPNVDSLSFGHCDYPYRNLGLLTNLQIEHTTASLTVTVDDKVCFSTDKVKLPVGYNFGITAASAETPDSFEAHRFIVHSLSPSASPPPPASNNAPRPPQDQTQVTTDQATVDLIGRIQSLATQMDRLQRTVDDLSSKTESQKQELLNSANANKREDSSQALSVMDARLQNIEQTIRTVQRKVENQDYKEGFEKLYNMYEVSHSNLMTHLPSTLHTIVSTSAPRMWIFVFWIVILQLMLVAAFVVYKRRRANAPKKYL